MPPKNLRELAKQGDPEIIAQIINHSLQKKGIQVQVIRTNATLEVTLESGQLANQKEVLVQFIRNGIDKLGVESIHTVTVYGVPTGKTAPVWEEEIILREPEEVIPPAGAAFEEDYATDDAETALETDEDYQTDPQDDFTQEDDEELFDDEDNLNSDGDFDDDSRGDFEEDSQADFEEDSQADFDEGEDEAKPAKKKLPILAIVLPLVILVPLLALAILHFTGIFRLPFLGGSEVETATPEAVPSPETSAPPTVQGSPSPEQPPGAETWANAVRSAISAANKAGTAQTRAEWNEVANEWQKAVDLMKEVPEDNPNYQTAQQKVEQYQNNLNVAKQRAARASN